MLWKVALDAGGAVALAGACPPCGAYRCMLCSAQMILHDAGSPRFASFLHVTNPESKKRQRRACRPTDAVERWTAAKLIGCHLERWSWKRECGSCHECKSVGAPFRSEFNRFGAFHRWYAARPAPDASSVTVSEVVVECTAPCPGASSQRVVAVVTLATALPSASSSSSSSASATSRASSLAGNAGAAAASARSEAFALDPAAVRAAFEEGRFELVDASRTWLCGTCEYMRRSSCRVCDREDAKSRMKIVFGTSSSSVVGWVTSSIWHVCPTCANACHRCRKTPVLSAKTTCRPCLDESAKKRLALLAIAIAGTRVTQKAPTDRRGSSSSAVAPPDEKHIELLLGKIQMHLLCSATEEEAATHDEAVSWLRRCAAARRILRLWRVRRLLPRILRRIAANRRSRQPPTPAGPAPSQPTSAKPPNPRKPATQQPAPAALAMF